MVRDNEEKARAGSFMKFMFIHFSVLSPDGIPNIDISFFFIGS